MNRNYIIFFTLLYLSNSFAGTGNIFKDGFEDFIPITSSKNVFLTGHSLLDDPLADYLQVISSDKGITYHWNEQNIVGSPIRYRTSGTVSPPNNWQGYSTGKNRDTFDMDIIAELANPATIGAGNTYDVLIITESHNIIDAIIWEYTNSLLRHYHDRLLTGNPNGETLFYQSWLDIDPNNPQLWIDHESLMVGAWECIAEKVNLTLEADGLPKNISVIPAGLALTNLLTRILNNEVAGFTGTDLQKIDQLFDDNVHLNAEGIFYMAAVSYVSIYGTSPVGATTPVGINPATGADLLQIAWEVVTTYQQNYTVKTMSQCRNLFATQICSSYYTFDGRPGEVAGCEDWMSTNTNNYYNQFNWPDPGLVVWPDP
jgi:hypothetical protein